MNEFSTGELMADLQVSLTEITLIGMLSEDNQEQYKDRLVGNQGIVDAIKTLLGQRFTQKELKEFLDYGYPRKVEYNGDLV